VSRQGASTPTQHTDFRSVIVYLTRSSSASKGHCVKKRAINRTAVVAAVAPEESEYQEGVLVQYYDEGYRYGHIASVDIDDDGELFCKVQPICSKFAKVVPRQLGYKSKDLTIQLRTAPGVK
jgi:hypothetical protein